MEEFSEKARLSGGRMGGGGGEATGLLGGEIRAGTRGRMLKRLVTYTVWSVEGVSGELIGPENEV